MNIKKIFLKFILGFICINSVSAQPLGNEPEIIRKRVSEHLELISQADREVVRNPKKTDLYVKRANLYVELYRMLNSGYLSNFYGEKPPELSVPAITEKAIADFSRAIKLAPRGELFVGRGEMFAVRWLDEYRYFNWYGAILDLEHPEWRDLIGGRTKENELIIFAKVLQSTDFANAERDFEKVLTITKDVNLAQQAHQNLAKIYLERARQIFYNLELNKNLIVQPNTFGYLIFDEIDRAIEHIRKSGSVSEDERRSIYGFLPTPSSTNWSLRIALYYKAAIADFYGKNKLALEALNEAENYFDKNEPFSKSVCDFYPLRGSIYLKLGNLDAAFADANIKYPNPNYPGQFCSKSYELQGDIYLAKGDYLTAITRYSNLIDNASSFPDVIYKKRGLAYIKLGEAEKAIADLNLAINHSPGTEEKYLLRAQAYRLNGDEKLALDDEKKARQIAESNSKTPTVKRGVYGKVVMPDGVSFDRQKIFVHLSYVAGRSLVWSPSVDEQGRFLFTNVEDKDFRLFAYIDGLKDGVAVRFYGLSDKMRIENKLVGPIILKLDRTVKLSKQTLDNKQ